MQMTMDYGSETFAAERAQFIEAITGFAAGATVAVIIRLLIRWRNGTKLAADDLSISLSLLPLWALVATGVISMYGRMLLLNVSLTSS